MPDPVSMQKTLIYKRKLVSVAELLAHYKENGFLAPGFIHFVQAAFSFSEKNDLAGSHRQT
ncbi:hypothetical protein CQ007_13420 [Pseudomonas sp. MYb185]|nr:hypothetical protein CQ007_13420 [Pseudomonas sp. MYb185]